MDFKKFGLIILLLGVFVLAFGAIQYMTNQPKNVDLSSLKFNNMADGIDDLGNLIGTYGINTERNQNRNHASTVMIVGGIILLLGSGLYFSQKSKNDALKSNIHSNTSNSQNDVIFCSKCGKQQSATSVGKFCDQCGNQL